MRSIENFKKRELTNDQLEKVHGGIIVNPADVVAIAIAVHNATEALADWLFED
ncbi:hypothetical protein [Kordia sp.]|uniref:hypothetical protein n=1 Tax=Kordia sp. TaxID=1965332 RepID=UPI003D6AB7F1